MYTHAVVLHTSALCTFSHAVSRPIKQEPGLEQQPYLAVRVVGFELLLGAEVHQAVKAQARTTNRLQVESNRYHFSQSKFETPVAFNPGSSLHLRPTVHEENVLSMST